MSNRKYEAEPESATGDFYVQRDQCIICMLPYETAPGIFGFHDASRGTGSRHRSINAHNLSASDDSGIAARFVRALSAPMSMISAPSATSVRANVNAASTSTIPSRQNESWQRLTIPMIKGGRGHDQTVPRATSFITPAESAAARASFFGRKNAPRRDTRTRAPARSLHENLRRVPPAHARRN